MKNIILILAMLFLLSGCGEIYTESNTETSVTTAVQTAAAPISSAETTAPEPPEKPEPLSASADSPYINTDDFSIIVQLDDLKSSLYYPDIVHDYGANDKLFVLEAYVKVRNTGLETNDFDINKLSIGSGDNKLFVCDDPENFKNIESGDTVRENVRFLCSLEQIAAAENVFYDDMPFEPNGELTDEKLRSVIQTQSAEDVKEYLYRQFVVDRDKYNITFAKPCSYTFEFNAVNDGDKKYFIAKITCYNRSDYAQLIEPDMFRPGYWGSCISDDTLSDSTERISVRPQFISVDEDLIYDPEECEKVKGISGNLYKIPPYICMNEKNPTKFTLVYDITDAGEISEVNFISSHQNEPWYNCFEENVNGRIVFDEPF